MLPGMIPFVAAGGPPPSTSLIPVMTGATTSGVTITSSNPNTFNTDQFAAWRGADNNPTGTSYLTANSATAAQWTVDFGTGVTRTLTEYRIWSIHSAEYVAGARNPNSWTLQGSNDGTNWTTVDTRTGQGSLWTAASQQRDFTFSNTLAFRYWRLAIDAVAGNLHGFSDCQFWGY